MMTPLPSDRRLPFGAIGLTFALLTFYSSACHAQDEGVSPGFFQKHIWGSGTLSYGGFELFPGFPGFGLSFHRGYGYGGNGLGTGAEGGYPYFGGPGYPHPAPVLRRCGGIAPFLYYGGPDYPRFGDSNYFSEVGPLSVRPPVAVVVTHGQIGYSGNFGEFTGTLPYPDKYFAPFVEAAALGVAPDVSSYPEIMNTVPPASPAPAPAPAALLRQHPGKRLDSRPQILSALRILRREYNGFANDAMHANTDGLRVVDPIE